MSMSNEQKINFKSYMMLGRKQYRNAQIYEAKRNYIEAEKYYFLAKQAYETAYNLAKKCNDFAQEEANREYRLSTKMYQNMVKINSHQK